MMSENSDIGGNAPTSLGGETKRTLEAKTGQRGLSNAMTFVVFSMVILMGTIGVIILAITPTLLPYPILLGGIVILPSIVVTLGFVLFKRANCRANHLANQRDPALEQAERMDKVVDALNLQIQKLTYRNKDLKCAYQEENHRAQVAVRSKTAFLAHLSHDIRTPLNHIIGFADMVSHEAFGPLGDKRYLTYVKDIKKSGENLLISVADVLELAELESGQRALCSEEILVDELLHSLKARFDERASRCNISLEVDCFCAAVLHGDRMGYERLLENLLDNAFKFTQGGGKIRLAAWVADDGIVLEVTDTGIGIHPSRLSQLLEPFAHHNALRAKGQKGIGLGLAIARSIAELSGGELAIDSSPSIGTTVVVSLPIAIAKSNVQIKAA